MKAPTISMGRSPSTEIVDGLNTESKHSILHESPIDSVLEKWCHQIYWWPDADNPWDEHNFDPIDLSTRATVLSKIWDEDYVPQG